MKYYSIHEFSQLIGRTTQTLRNWDRKGTLVPHHKGPSGYRYYSEDQLHQVLGIKTPERIVIGYCRVSSHKQKDDLARQIERVTTYLTAQGQPFEIISDIGSGINYHKKGLQELIHRIEHNEVRKVVALYKDRLLRFGVELLEYVAAIHGTTVEIIDSTDKTEEQELVEDLVQIITVFASRLHGKRAAKARQMAQELLVRDA